jgi:hypothetical protein
VQDVALLVVRNLHRIVAEVRQLEIPTEQTAIGMGIRAHAPAARGRQLAQLRH